MEDAATAEISRAQVWQWIRHKAKLADGRMVDLRSAASCSTKSWQKLKAAVGADAYETGRFGDAAAIFRALIEAPRFPEWLTIPAYEKLIAEGA